MLSHLGHIGRIAAMQTASTPATRHISSNSYWFRTPELICLHTEAVKITNEIIANSCLGADYYKSIPVTQGTRNQLQMPTLYSKIYEEALQTLDEELRKAKITAASRVKDSISTYELKEIGFNI